MGSRLSLADGSVLVSDGLLKYADRFYRHLASAVPGFVDYLPIAREAPKAHHTATKHLGLGLTLAVLYLINLFLRRGGTVPEGGSVMVPVLLNLIGASMLGLQGWLGGELVYKHGIGVSQQR